ncbi:MAG TPA: outer membrane beta-barrel protein [Puia sp.]|nr:outer membrane beta-barrel protein [Puia sp.]
MKERIFFDDEFEGQLKEKSDQFKMYPSDKVWNEIHRSLHTKRIRFVIGMSILVGGILILAGIQLISPSKNTLSVKTSPRPAAQAEAADALDLKAFNAFAEPRVNVSKPDNDHSAKGPWLSLPALEESDAGMLAFSNSPTHAEIRSNLSSIQAKNQSGETALTEQSVTPSIPSDITAPGKQSNSNQLPELAPTADEAAATTAERTTKENHHIKNDRFSWEIYVSPTLTTRSLNGVNYQQIYQTIQNAPITVVRFANVNGFVDNTPAMGYDIGGSLLYRLSKNLSLKAGLQFSFSRYYISAFSAGPSQARASLSSYFGYIADSLLNNNSGNAVNPKNAQQYQNKFYQLSMPVGIEWKVAGKDRLQFHVSATIQPSYLLNQDIYVLSRDYSSYTKDPAALRRWNFNVGADAFISYRIGKSRLELGPMMRYQILSTYKSDYPLKENMTNYGIRLGFSRPIR